MKNIGRYFAETFSSIGKLFNLLRVRYDKEALESDWGSVRSSLKEVDGIVWQDVMEVEVKLGDLIIGNGTSSLISFVIHPENELLIRGLNIHEMFGECDVEIRVKSVCYSMYDYKPFKNLLIIIKPAYIDSAGKVKYNVEDVLIKINKQVVTLDYLRQEVNR